MQWIGQFHSLCTILLGQVADDGTQKLIGCIILPNVHQEPGHFSGQLFALCLVFQVVELLHRYKAICKFNSIRKKKKTKLKLYTHRNQTVAHIIRIIFICLLLQWIYVGCQTVPEDFAADMQARNIVKWYNMQCLYRTKLDNSNFFIIYTHCSPFCRSWDLSPPPHPPPLSVPLKSLSNILFISLLLYLDIYIYIYKGVSGCPIIKMSTCAPYYQLTVKKSRSAFL